MQGTIFLGDVKIRRFRIFWPFSWPIIHSFGFQRRFSGPVKPVTMFRGGRQNSLFCVLWPFLSAMAPSFCFRGRFSGPVTPVTMFGGGRRNSLFSRSLAVFVGYSTQFLLPGTIFGARDARYTISGPTSKLIVFNISGRFRGLYTTQFCVPGIIFGNRVPRYTVSGAT